MDIDPERYAAIEYLAEGLADSGAACLSLPARHSSPCATIWAKSWAKSWAWSCALPGKTLVIVDAVSMTEGDYIDIGPPDGAAFVPLVIKLLAFSGETTTPA